MGIKPRYKGLVVTINMEQAFVPVTRMVNKHSDTWLDTCACGLVHTWKRKSGREDNVANCRKRTRKYWDDDCNDEYDELFYVCKCGREVFPGMVSMLVAEQFPAARRISGEMVWTPTKGRVKKPPRPDFNEPEFLLQDYIKGIEGKAFWTEYNCEINYPGWSGNFVVNGAVVEVD